MPTRVALAAKVEPAVKVAKVEKVAKGVLVLKAALAGQVLQAALVVPAVPAVLVAKGVPVAEWQDPSTAAKRPVAAMKPVAERAIAFKVWMIV